MAITFDTVNKIIQLDRYSVSVNELWTAYVNWSVLSDNIKYGELMSQIGGTPPIALYIYMENGWLIRPQELDGTTTISGNLLTHIGTSPIAKTLTSVNVLVNMETPVQAVSISTSSGGSGGLTDLDLAKIQNKLDVLQTAVDFAINGNTIDVQDTKIMLTDAQHRVRYEGANLVFNKN